MPESYLHKKELGVFSLAFIGLSAMLGSGWLLAPYFVYQQAGNYSILSWIIGYVMIMVIALSFAETCSMIGRDGSTVILPRLSHGYFLSAMFGFFGLISWVALIPIEVTASLHYLTYFLPGLYTATKELTHFGLFIAIMLVILISLLNTASMFKIKQLNNYIFTPMKIGIPVIVIIYSIYHASVTTQTLAPVHTTITGIFLAIPLGVIFSFNAFKAICVLAGRAHNPQKTITRALVLSLTTCLFIYLGLQYAFDSNATTGVLNDSLSPFASILSSAALMLLLLYIGAVTSPFTANIFNLNAANTCCYRISKFGYLPKKMQKMNRYYQYIYANLFNSIIAIILIINSTSWHEMVQNLTCIMVITYAAAPIALVAFRRNLPTIKRPFTLKHGRIMGFLGFLFSNYMIFWSGYDAIFLSLEVLLGLSVFIVIYYRFTLHAPRLDFFRATWIFAWLGSIAVISKFSVFGGTGAISHLTAIGIISILSFVLYVIIAKSSLSESDAMHEFESIAGKQATLRVANP